MMTETLDGPGRRDEASASSDLRVEGLEQAVQGLHVKLDGLVEHAAEARADIAWLKWGIRLLFAVVLGVGGVAAHGVHA